MASPSGSAAFAPEDPEHRDKLVRSFAAAFERYHEGRGTGSPVHDAIVEMRRRGVEISTSDFDPGSPADRLSMDAWPDDTSSVDASGGMWAGAGFSPSESVRWRTAGVENHIRAAALRGSVSPEAVGLEHVDGGTIGARVNDGRISSVDEAVAAVRQSMRAAWMDEQGRQGF